MTHQTHPPVSICPKAMMCYQVAFLHWSLSAQRTLFQDPLYTREIWLSHHGYHFFSSDRKKEKSGMKGQQIEWWKSESLSQHLKAVAEEGDIAGSKLRFHVLVSIILLLFNLMYRHISQSSCQPATFVALALVSLCPRLAGCSPAPFVHVLTPSGTMKAFGGSSRSSLGARIQRKLFGKWPQETLKGSRELRWERKESQKRMYYQTYYHGWERPSPLRDFRQTA